MIQVGTDKNAGINFIAGASSLQAYQTMKTRSFTIYITFAVQTRSFSVFVKSFYDLNDSTFQVDCIEMSKPIVDELKMLEKDGVPLYDAFLQKEVLAVSPVLCIICDDPRASEVTNNMGPGSKMFCRMCMLHMYTIIIL